MFSGKPKNNETLALELVANLTCEWGLEPLGTSGVPVYQGGPRGDINGRHTRRALLVLMASFESCRGQTITNSCVGHGSWSWPLSREPVCTVQAVECLAIPSS